MTPTHLPSEPHWHPGRRGVGARTEVVDAIVEAVSHRTDADHAELREAVQGALADWRFAFEQQRRYEPFDNHGEDTDRLRVVAIGPVRPFTDDETDARGTDEARRRERSAFDQWCRVNADSPQQLAAPEFGREQTSPLSLITLQRTWWRTGDGRWVRLTDMEPSHRRRLLASLTKRAMTWLTSYSMSLGALPDEVSDPLDEYGTQPGVWLEQQPLVARLVDLIAADRERAAYGGGLVPHVTAPLPRRREPAGERP